MENLDELLYQHAAEARDIWLSTFPCDEKVPKYHHSRRFLRNMNKLMVREFRSPAMKSAIKGLQRIAIALLVLLAITAGLVGSHPKVRAAVFSYIREVYENSVFYRFFGKSAGVLPDLSPGWVPEGMTLVREERGETRQLLVYMNEDSGEIVLFDYMRMDEGAYVSLFSNKEGIVQEDIQLGQMKGVYYPAKEGSETSVLVCIDPVGDKALSISSNLDRETILRIAESISCIS